MKRWLSAIAAITLVLVSVHTARAQDTQAEITLLAPGITQEPVEQLLKGFEAKTGHKVKATFGNEDGTKQQIIKGEPFDVPLLETTGKTPIEAVTASGTSWPPVPRRSPRFLLASPCARARPSQTSPPPRQ